MSLARSFTPLTRRTDSRGIIAMYHGMVEIMGMHWNQHEDTEKNTNKIKSCLNPPLSGVSTFFFLGGYFSND